MLKRFRSYCSGDSKEGSGEESLEIAPEALTKGGQEKLARLPLPAREKWASKIEFLLAVIGFSVDLGNVWRFPYMCYRNGGGAFLIPYFVMFFLGGLPLFFLEVALGQFQRCGCVSIWKNVCPLFKGIGFAICVIATYMAFFYNTIISWAVYFMFSSFQSPVPWKTCNNSWNTNSCAPVLSPEEIALSPYLLRNSTNSVSAAAEFFMREVLEIHRSTGIEDLGNVKWTLALCLILVYILVYFALWKGPRSSGKAVWITATLPYVVLIALLFRGLTLPGASSGIYYYLNPDWTRLNNTKVWIDAATQVFFSLGPGFGVLLALSSYNEFHNNCYKDAMLTSAINCLTSLLAGLVIFSTLGYMSNILDKDVREVAGEGGPGLVFIVYPQAIATMKWAPFWSVIFFFMLITLGIDSTFAGLEAMITAFCDEFPETIGQRRELFVFGLMVYCFIGSLSTATYGGNYLIEFLDQYGVSFSILLVVVIETVAVCWFYGVNKFSNDVQSMLGFRPGLPWRICWLIISPLFIFGLDRLTFQHNINIMTLFTMTVLAPGGPAHLQEQRVFQTIIFIFACLDLKPLEFEGYRYPNWSTGLGWCVRLSSIICIPGYMIYKWIILSGSPIERLKKSITPEAKPDLNRRRSSCKEGFLLKPRSSLAGTALDRL